MNEKLEKLTLKVEEACKLTGFSRGMGYQLVARGEWPSIRVGRSVRVPVAGLREWVARKSAEGTEEPKP